MKITLASTSKFKNEILSRVHIKHDCIDPVGDECCNSKDPYEYVMNIARKKVESVKGKISEGIIIGMDTIVLIDDKIVEKPKSLQEAKDNLIKSSNNETKVITGIALYNTKIDEMIVDYQETIVKMKEINDDDILYYIENEEDVMYASGFIIENIASNFIDYIYGSYYNILGVPVEKIYELFNRWGITLRNINCD